MERKELLEGQYKILIERLSEYSGILFQLEKIYKAYKIDLKNKEPLGGLGGFFLGNLFHFYDPETGKLISCKKYEVSLENLDWTISQINAQTCNYYAAQAFEAIETYLKSVAAVLIIEEKELSLTYDKRLGFYDYNSCRIFLSSFYKDIVGLFKIIIHLSPLLQEKQNSQEYISVLIASLKVFAQCRHAIVHSEDRLEEKTLDRFSSFERELLQKFVFKEKVDDRFFYRINTTEKISEILERIGQVGFTINKNILQGIINKGKDKE